VRTSKLYPNWYAPIVMGRQFFILYSWDCLGLAPAKSVQLLISLAPFLIITVALPTWFLFSADSKAVVEGLETKQFSW
jgi:hypothetical protein